MCNEIFLRGDNKFVIWEHMRDVLMKRGNEFQVMGGF
jgi:hypothetical protein